MFNGFLLIWKYRANFILAEQFSAHSIGFVMADSFVFGKLIVGTIHPKRKQILLDQANLKGISFVLMTIVYMRYLSIWTLPI